MPERHTDRTQSLPRRALRWILVGAALGTSEATLRILIDGDPSVVRRSWSLAAQAACLYGIGGLVAAFLNGALRTVSSPTNELRRRVAVWAAAIVLALALLAFGPAFSKVSGASRAFALIGALSIAAGIGWGAAHFLAPRLVSRGELHLTRWASSALVVCAFALVLRRALPRESQPEATANAGAPHVVLIVVDTLRADVLGCYGDEGGHSPNIDALARGGTLFTSALAPAPWTLPSVASLLTGDYPAEHGVVDFDRALVADSVTLPSLLRRAGYHTRAAIGNVLIDASRGFARSFDVFDLYHGQVASDLFGSRLISEVLRLRRPLRTLPRRAKPYVSLSAASPWLVVQVDPVVDDPTLSRDLLECEPLPTDRPLFLYAHYTAPHRPYVDHLGVARTSWMRFRPEHVEVFQKLYRREVEHTDRAIGALLADLDRRGILDNAIVVLTSDHGEEFLEHGGSAHGANGLYGEVVDVPLIFSGPGVAPGLVHDTAVSLVDVAPTLLELCGLEEAPSMFGRSLAPALRADEPLTHLPLFSEARSLVLDTDQDAYAIQRDGWKIVHRRDTESALIAREIFDLTSDPLEQKPLDDVPAELRGLLEELERFEERPVAGARGELDTEALEKLRALGYGH